MNTKTVVRLLGASRLAIGAGFGIAPRRLAGPDTDVFMTQSFAIREAVLGVGGLMDGRRRPATWAALGTLVDAGDVAAAVLALRRREPAAPAAALVAAIGLLAEGLAARKSRPADAA